MTGVKISALPAANAANDTDQLEVNQGGTSRRLTVGQLATAFAPDSDAINVGDYGAVGDGVADDTAAIQAAIAAAGAAPCGTVLLAGKTYKITATLDIPYPNVRIIGGGSDVAHTAGSQGQQAATKLVWGGADGGTMMHFRSPIGPTAQALTGGGCTGVYFHCAGSSAAGANRGAAVGIRISSRRNGWYEDIYFEQPMNYGFLLDTVTELGDDRGCHNNVFFSCASRNTYSNVDGGFVKLEGDITVPPGEVNANCYFNLFQNCRPVFNSGNCYDFGNSDNNTFIRCSANAVNHSYTVTPANATISLANPCVVTAAAHGFITGHCVQFISNTDTLPAPLAFSTKYYVTAIDANTFNLSTTLANRVAGVLIDTSASSQSGTHKLLAYSGFGILFRGSNLNGHTARNNIFTAWSGGDVIYCEGTEGGLAFPSHHNIFLHMETSNSTPVPTIGTGSSCSVMAKSDGTQPKPKLLAASIGGPSLLPSQNSLLMDKVQARMGAESLRISNGSIDHIRFELPDGTYDTVTAEWNVGITGTGDLRWARPIGTGNMLINNVGFRVISQTNGLGYGTGSGGTATQLTSKATLVTLNRNSGLITTFNDALAAGAVVTFRWNCSAVAVGDVVIVNHDSNATTPTAGGTPGAYALSAHCDAGFIMVSIRNLTAGSLSEAIDIRFAVIKGVVA